MAKDADILLVEDSAADADLASRALAKADPAVVIVHAEDGTRALDYLFARGEFQGRDVNRLPKLVLLDVKLPRLDGQEVLKLIRADTRYCFLPVVMLSSSGEERDLRACYDAGASSYVVKPVKFDEYMERITALGRYWLAINRTAANLR